MFKQLFATKSLEMLAEEARGDNRLRRILGPIGLTSLGVGAIIGAGIFVMTGRVAANDAGPGILVSFAIAGVACALAAFCYAEFAAMAPVAGSAYTYAYATLGELFAWIIGWDLILEYAMSAATVASAWSEYLNAFLEVALGVQIPAHLCSDPFSHHGAWLNVPAIAILLACTVVLVLGIRESAFSNTLMVVIKLGVVVFVIVVGLPFVNPANWTRIPAEARKTAEHFHIPELAVTYAAAELNLDRGDKKVVERAGVLSRFAVATLHIERSKASGDPDYIHFAQEQFARRMPSQPGDIVAARILVDQARESARLEPRRQNWGLLGQFGINEQLASLDNTTRSNFMPYGISGVIFGASIVFFAFIGFDSISTHAEEAIAPQRDLPFGILTSLVLCSVLYVGVSAVITGMVPYPEIDTKAAVAAAFHDRAEQQGGILTWAAALIALGGLAGMTSVLLITFLSQARIFLAMARDGLLPHGVFGVVHERFKTPHVSTILTGLIMAVVAGFTPITLLEEMVNIGTLFAFVVVCAAVLILRIKRPDAPRPFRCPAVFLVAPLGIAVNLGLMLFLPIDTWLRLLIWLAIGLGLYFSFGYRFSTLAEKERTGM